jgi:regulator of protease activity HflC (stomatin/prohibitin superfamily)
MEFVIVLFIAVMVFIIKAVKVVPQQHAYIVERLGRYHATLTPGLNILIPFVDRLAYKHSLKEVPLDVPSQICITRDNTQLKVDGILYFQVTDPQRASYGTSDYLLAITQLSQTTLRSIIGKMELDKTFEERDEINQIVVASLDEAAINWGVKVLRYEIKDLVPPQDILHSMQAQITAEREKRARIAQSEGVKMEQINLANGAREAAIQKSQGEMQATINNSEGNKQAAINKAQGEAEALRLVADATADAVRRVAEAVTVDGGIEAVNLKVAEQYIAAFAQLAKQNNTVILPANVADVSSLVATALSVVKQSNR